MYLSEAVHAAFFAVLFAAVAVACGVLGEVFIKSKQEKENPDEVAKIDAKSITHYVLTFLSLAVVFYAFGTFANPAYGYYSFGSGKYGYEISFWGVGEIIPAFAYNMGHNFLPLLMLIFAIYCKPLAFCAAGLLSWVDILIVNTSKVFGIYTIVAAAGNESARETVVYNFANDVVTAICILSVAMFVLAVIHLIVFRSKKVAAVCVLVGALCVGLFSMYMGYDAYAAAKTFDIEKHRNDIYVTTKEGSENFQAENFHNSFGDMNTKCAYPGCDRRIVTSGDSNCCSAHSNRCGNCNKYIDGDAMFCMDCIREALE
jgi:hypothetical protein